MPTLTLTAALALAPACTQVSEYMQLMFMDAEEDAAEDNLEFFRWVLKDRAVSAKIQVEAYPYMEEFRLSPDEFARMRDILLNSRTVPVALNRDVVVFVAYGSFETLILTDAQGQSYDLPVITRVWMKQSQADSLTPSRVKRSDEPRWYLPDADYDAFFSLPTIRKATEWGQRHARGKNIALPNS